MSVKAWPGRRPEVKRKVSECRDREGGGRGERFGLRSIDGCSAVVPSADPSPNPLLGIMTAR